jgi:hypothetical protein
MKVIFIDFDGVLAPYGQNYQAGKFSKSCVDSLNKVLEAVPDAKLVVSSTWRSHGLKYVKDMMERNGVTKNKIIGITPEDKIKGREHHIQEYLNKNKDISKFVIIDDDYIDILKSHWTKVNKHIGLTESDAWHAIDILK